MLWVRRQNVFGQRVAVAWANNGDFLANALDNLAGSERPDQHPRPAELLPSVHRSTSCGDARTSGCAPRSRSSTRELKDTEQQLTELEAGAQRRGRGWC